MRLGLHFERLRRRLRPSRAKAALAVPTLDRLRRACEAVFYAAEAGGYGLDWQAAVRKPALLREAVEAAPDALLAFAGVGLLRAVCDESGGPLEQLSRLPEAEACALVRALVGRWVATCEEEVARAREREAEVVQVIGLPAAGDAETAPGLDRVLVRLSATEWYRLTHEAPLGACAEYAWVHGLDQAHEQELRDMKPSGGGAYA